jgi:hypothetical protein
MPVILASQEAEIRRTKVQSQPEQIVRETLSKKKKKPSQKRAGGVGQGVGPEFKPQYCKKKKRKKLQKTSSLLHLGGFATNGRRDDLSRTEAKQFRQWAGIPFIVLTLFSRVTPTKNQVQPQHPVCKKSCQAQWLTYIIPATWEAEIGRIMAQGQPRQKVTRLHLSK